VGAILTQNTSWRNVEKAIESLRACGWLSPRTLSRVPESRLAPVIRSSGYFRQKARKLHAFLAYLNGRHGGRLERMSHVPTAELRSDLLAVWGIGPETADSILLYGFGRPVFVVDAYTHRILKRHGLHPGGGYETVRGFFEDQLADRPDLYNDFHAQLVWVGHRFCGTRPRCEECPLLPLLPKGRPPAEERARARSAGRKR